MKGYIKGKTIILNEPLPADINEGEEVEVIIISRQKNIIFLLLSLASKMNH